MKSFQNLNILQNQKIKQYVQNKFYKIKQKKYIKLSLLQRLIYMSTTIQNWHDVVMKVQSSNLDKQSLQAQITHLNKKAYKQQLDRQIQHKHQYQFIQTGKKKIQLEQVKKLARLQQEQKSFKKHKRQQKQKKYSQQNLNLIDQIRHIKTISTQLQRQNVRNYLEHPFVKLVDKQQQRMYELKKKFIKQNQINHLQQEIKNQTKNFIKFKEMKEKTEYINFVDKSEQKRSKERERFKQKYLKIKNSQMSPPKLNDQQAHGQVIQTQPTPQSMSPNPKTTNPPLTIQKSYLSYLNHQIKQNEQKKYNQKHEIIDDKRLRQFYNHPNDQHRKKDITKNTKNTKNTKLSDSNTLEPDSSPAYLGRNPLSYQRRRQLYYINKHLNTNNVNINGNNNIGGGNGYDRSLTSEIHFRQNKPHLNSSYNNQAKMNQYVKLNDQLNPQINKRISNNHNSNNLSESAHIIRPYINASIKQKIQRPMNNQSMNGKNQQFDSNNKPKYLLFQNYNGNNRQQTQLQNDYHDYNERRRIKSELVEQEKPSSIYYRKLPTIFAPNQPQSNFLSQQPQKMFDLNNNAIVNKTNQNSSIFNNKKQYVRYDFITQKQVKYYA